MTLRHPPTGTTNTAQAHAHRVGAPRRILSTIVAVLIAGIGSGAAYAYFTSSASGTGAADDATLLPVSLTGVATLGTPLLPGGTGDVVFRVTNPNGTAVSMVGVALNGAVTPDASHPGCSTTDANPVVTLDVPSGDLPVSLPARSTTTVTLAGAASMDVDATSNCQGAAFSFPLTVTVHL